MSAGTPLASAWRFFKRLPIPGVAWGVIVLFVAFSIIRPNFLSPYNIQLILRHSSVLIIASIGMTLTILVSQIDMSVGSVMSLAGVVAAVCIGHDLPLWLSAVIALLCGAAIGLVNGIMVAAFKFDFWIVTFATMGIAAGLALVVANGATVPVLDEDFGEIGNGRIGGVYILIYLMVIIVAAMMFVLHRTRFGYNIYSIGGSEQAARLSGIPVTRERIIVYVTSGAFAAVAGLLLASMGNSASPIAGVNYSFDAIAAVIIGGASFQGGFGTLTGTVLGALLVRIMASGLNLLNVPATWQKAIIGLVVVLIIVASVSAEKMKKRNEQRRRYADA